jgi:hypothetical protein
MSTSAEEPEFATLADFYRFYLGEHRNGVCRALHFVGTTVGLTVLITGLLLPNWWMVGLAGVPGYAFAWTGHFLFEKNRPATFKYPLRSLACDFIMWKDILMFRVPAFGELPSELYSARRPADIAA